MKEYQIAVVGATGAVGQKIIQLLEHTSIPIKKIKTISIQAFCGKENHLPR